MAKKAQMGITFENMAKILLLIIIAIVFFIFVNSGSSTINSFVKGVCDRYPILPFCKGGIELSAGDVASADNAAKALTCAINTVGRGDGVLSPSDGGIDCTKYKYPTYDSTTGDWTMGFSPNFYTVTMSVKIGIFTGSNIENCKVLCKQVCEGIPGCKVDESKIEVDTSGRDHCLCPARMPKDPFIKCDAPGKCDIYNLRLPQDVPATAKNYIIDNGDPNFLVYWQSFPMEQDTWSFQNDAGMTASILFLTALPPGKVMTAIGSALGRETAAKISGLVAQKMGTKAIQNQVRRELIADLSSVLEYRLNHLGRAALKFGALEGAALVKAQAESMVNKYNIHGNAIVLKKPYDKEQEYKLIDGLKGKPVLIEWSHVQPAHIVSPCTIKKMSVSAASYSCTQYTYDYLKGSVSCGEPRSSSGGTACNISTYLGINSDFVNNMEVIKNTPINEEVDKLKTLQSQGLQIYEWEITESNSYNENDNVVKGEWRPLNTPSPFRIRIVYNGKEMILNEGGEREATLADGSKVGYYEIFSLKDCTTQAVVAHVDYNDDNIPKATGEYNYCLNTQSTVSKYKDWIGMGVGLGGPALVRFIPGASFKALFLLATYSGSSALQISAMYDKWDGFWPGSPG